MTPTIHLEIIEKKQSYQAEKYANSVCQQVISATIDMYTHIGFHKLGCGF
jgi:hypothetical protein